MMLTVKELREALSNLEDDDYIYVSSNDGNESMSSVITSIEDSTCVGFYELKIDKNVSIFSKLEEKG